MPTAIRTIPSVRIAGVRSDPPRDVRSAGAGCQLRDAGCTANANSGVITCATAWNPDQDVDGDGYPDGLHGEQIPLGSRMLAVVDGYLTMMTDRPFAPRLSQAEAMAELERCSGTQFDGMLVRLYLAQIRGKQKSVARSQ